MRVVNGIFALLLFLFAAVQINDPDGLFWAVCYGVGALWCAVAAFRPVVYRAPLIASLFGLTGLAALYGVFAYWPKTPRWWAQDVWWETETAREGMGMMILVLALALAAVIVLRTRRG